MWCPHKDEDERQEELHLLAIHPIVDKRRDLSPKRYGRNGHEQYVPMNAISSNLSNVFVCRRFPTNKNLILCALCGNILKGISICVLPRESAVNSF